MHKLVRSLGAAGAAIGLLLAGKQALAGPFLQEEVAEPELPPAAREPEPPELAGDLRYRADRMRYDTQARRVYLDGNVVIERGEGRLYAPRGVVDRAEGRMRLEGGVLAVQGLQVAVADVALVDLRSSKADLVAATLYLKDRAAGPALAGLQSRPAARGAGKNTLVLHGSSVQQLPGGALLARDVALTPCDCAGPPDYQVLSPEVELHRDRALLKSPKLDLFGAALPIFVPISLPLTERQSGLLAPRFGFQLTTGFGIVEPVFVTLGRSWDATAAAGWTTGTSPGGSAAPGSRTVRGPRLDLELRGAPASGIALRLDADLVQDLDQGQSQAQPANAFGVPGSARGRGLGGLRGFLRYSERTEAGAWQTAVDGTLATDAMLLNDSNFGVLERSLDALRTDAGVWARLGPAMAGLDSTLLLDMRVPDGNHPDRRLYGAEARRTLQRLPALFAQLPAQPLAGPFFFSGEASAVRFQPLRARDQQELATGFGPTDINAAGAPALLTADPEGFARASVVRFDAAPRVSATLARGPLGAVSAYAGARADAWLFDGDPKRDRRRLYGMAGLRAQTELSRSFGALVHTIAPSLEVKAISPAMSSGQGPPIGDPEDQGGPAYAPSVVAAQQGLSPGQPLRLDPKSSTVGVPGARRGYDELDGAAPSGGAVQLVARVDQSLWSSGAPGRPPTRAIDLTLAQDALLFAGDDGRARVAEAWAKAAVRLGPVNANLRAQYDWGARAFSGLGLDGSVGDGRGDNLHFGLLAFRSSSSELLRAGADELFSTVRLARDGGDLVGSGSAGFLVRLPIERPPISVGYTFERHLGPLPADTRYADTTHHLAAQIETPCRCAGVSFALDLPFASGTALQPSVHFLLDLKTLGSFGSP